MNENEIEQTFTIADLRAQLEAERAGHRALVKSHIDLLVDNQGLAADLAAANARLAEVLDENQLLRDDAADAPIPFAINEQVHLATPDLTLVPNQRAAGGQS